MILDTSMKPVILDASSYYRYEYDLVLQKQIQ